MTNRQIFHNSKPLTQPDPENTVCFQTGFSDLYQQLFDLLLHRPDLLRQLARLVRRDGSSDDGSTDAAGTAQRDLGGDENVGHVLVLAEEREVEEDLDRGSVASHDDELCDATVEGFRGFVRAFLELAVVGGGLLDNSRICWVSAWSARGKAGEELVWLIILSLEEE